MLYICPPHQEGWKRVSKFFIWAGACTGTDAVLEQKMHYLFLYRNIYSTCSHSSITNIFLRQHFIFKNLSYHRRHTRNRTFVHVSNKRRKGILSILVCFGYRWQGLVVGSGLCEKRSFLQLSDLLIQNTKKWNNYLKLKNRSSLISPVRS